MNSALIKPQWSPLTVALMVLGFIVFWPLGLAMLAYILWGEHFGGSQQRAQDWFEKQKASFSKGGKGFSCHSRSGATGNAAFDDYRREQLDRLEAERRRLDEEREAFAEYLKTLHMARDREEFDRFMRERNASSGHHHDGDRPHYG